MKVIIVGAGLAGLTAATQLVAEGVDAMVLEARNRVGGRMHGIEIAPETWADAGAAYLGQRHTELRALIEQCGLATIATTMTGDSRFALTGDSVRCPGRFPPLNAVVLGELFDRLDELTTNLRVDAPWLGPNAAYLDTVTAGQWVEQLITHPDARLFFRLFLGEIMAADPEEISALHMGFYLRSGGGIQYLNAFEGGAQEQRIVNGAHRLCEMLAEQLGDRVRLSAPVRTVRQDADGVTVHSERGTFQGSAAIIAVPPLLADKIAYEPKLAVRRTSDRTAIGCAVKVHLIYPAPLWRRHALSGWSLSKEGPLLSTVDDSPSDGRVGILTGFVTGKDARQFSALPAPEQRHAVLTQLATLFPELPEPTAYYATDWISAEYSRGCYAALFGPGDWLSHGGHLTCRHGRLHWAGTETSTEFFGLMEGAVRSGHRAACEILGTY